MADCRRVLNRHGLTVSAMDAPVKPIDANRAHVSMTFVVTHAATDAEQQATREMVADAQKGRPLDKAILGAQTSLWGYFLRDYLSLPRLTEQEISDRNDVAFDPNAIGRDLIKSWLQPWCSRLDISPEYLRAQMAKGGIPADTIAGKPETWPRTLMDRLEKFLTTFEQRNGARGAKSAPQDIKALPQREDAPKPSEKPKGTAPKSATSKGVEAVAIGEEDIPF